MSHNSQQNSITFTNLSRTLIQNRLVQYISGVTVHDDTIRVVRIENVRPDYRIRREANLENILRKLGEPGKFQVLLFIFASSVYILMASNNLAPSNR